MISNSSISSEQLSSTHTEIPFLAEQEGRVANDTSNYAKHFKKRELYCNAYAGIENSYSSYSSTVISRVPGSYDTTFQKEITFFYEQLMASQKPLGVEFENILFNNLWNLYED